MDMRRCMTDININLFILYLSFALKSFDLLRYPMPSASYTPSIMRIKYIFELIKAYPPKDQ